MTAANPFAPIRVQDTPSRAWTPAEDAILRQHWAQPGQTSAIVRAARDAMVAAGYPARTLGSVRQRAQDRLPRRTP